MILAKKEWLMNTGKTVFSQVMDFLPLHEFHKCVERYSGNYKVQKFSCLDQYLCMTFAQLTFRESLRDIIACLQSCRSKLYHMGIRGPVSRSTLADANDSRDWRIYADFAQVLIHQARQLYLEEPFGIDLENTIYALDATTIDLCLALFPWAHFRKNKGAIKLHTLLDLRGPIPSFIEITDGKVADVNILDILIPEAGSFYIMDRGYLDFARLYAMHQAHATFVTRTKSNTQFRRLYSRPVDKTTGLRCDQTIVLTGTQSSKNYPSQLRLIKFFDFETKKYFNFLTNNFDIDALIVAKLYKCRWKVELFFRWIKQHLRIKAFFGTSENAVRTQVWIAISVYVLVAIIKKRLALEPSLYTILQIFSVNIFEKTLVSQLLTKNRDIENQLNNHNQLDLFNL
jgi:hypothetical protein